MSHLSFDQAQSLGVDKADEGLGDGGRMGMRRGGIHFLPRPRHQEGWDLISKVGYSVSESYILALFERND